MKVLCTGFHKTGLTTLHYCLREMGFDVADGHNTNKQGLDKLEDWWPLCLNKLPDYDAYVDNPWNVFWWKMLCALEDEDVYVIHTARDVDDWYKSCCRHFGDNDISLHDAIYGGDAVNNEMDWKWVFKKHNHILRNYVDNYENAVELDIVGGNTTWEYLSTFLGREVDKSGPLPNFKPGMRRVS